ncbi:MAG: nucleoside triphosphate pyrophosphohydrolase [Anaerovoracaceae bacterium]
MKKEYEKLYDTKETEEEALRRLIEIVGVLRQECPWDKVQTHQTLTACMTEEAYEVVDAIQKNDYENLKEELGDVLLQVVFHGILGEEKELFDIKGVINDECEKMIRRHPHIFLEENVKTIDKALEKWENMKSKEQCSTTYTDRLKKVPLALPALTRSYKIQKRAAVVGFDWDDVNEAFSKVNEESEELIDAYRKGDRAGMTEELGDLLFSVVNVSRFLDINPEEALNSTSVKFIKRFAYIEDKAIERGVSIQDMTLDEMDKLWNEAKK